MKWLPACHWKYDTDSGMRFTKAESQLSLLLVLDNTSCHKTLQKQPKDSVQAGEVHLNYQLSNPNQNLFIDGLCRLKEADKVIRFCNFGEWQQERTAHPLQLWCQPLLVQVSLTEWARLFSIKWWMIYLFLYLRNLS